MGFRRSLLQLSPLGVVADANGESGALAGEDGTDELYSPPPPRGDGTDSDGGRTMVMLRVTVAAGASGGAVPGAAAAAEGEEGMGCCGTRS